MEEILRFYFKDLPWQIHSELCAPLISYPVTHDKHRRVTALFYSCLVRLFVDIVSLVLE